MNIELTMIKQLSELLAFRLRHNLTQRSASELLGYGYESWASYENGRRPTPKHLLKHIEHYNQLIQC